MSKLRVLVADDQRVVRQGLRLLLGTQPNIEVVAEAENGREAVRLAKTLQPDVVVMEVAMPLLNGDEATRQICETLPGIKVLALSSYEGAAWVGRMTQAGARGYVAKATAAEELVAAINAVGTGHSFVSPRLLT